MLVKIENGVPTEWPVGEDRIKHENPNISFPKDMSNLDFTSYGYAKFTYTDKPSYDREYKNCTEVTPVLSGDTYLQTWSVSEKFNSEERAAYDTKKAAADLENTTSLAIMKRNRLLVESDWTQLPDSPADKSSWATYRTALRDLTTHTNWPNLEDADWPTEPS